MTLCCWVARISNSAEGMLAAYYDDVYVVGPPEVAVPAAALLVQQAKDLLGLEQRVEKGSVCWSGSVPPDVAVANALLALGLSPAMPGVVARLAADVHLGVPCVGSGLEAAAAATAALQRKFEDRATLLARLHTLRDRQCIFTLLRSVACTRPGYWLRAMPPELTSGPALWYDKQVARCYAECALDGAARRRREFLHVIESGDDLLRYAPWTKATLANHFGGLGLTSQSHTAAPAHYAMWLNSFSRIQRLFPSAFVSSPSSLFSPSDVSSSPAPFAHGILTSHAMVNSHLTHLTSNPNNTPVSQVPSIPASPVLPSVDSMAGVTPHARCRCCSLLPLRLPFRLC